MIQINQINKGVKMKLHHTKYKENYKKYILSTIETGINDEPLKTDKEKIKYIFNLFNSEYGRSRSFITPFLRSGGVL